MPCIMCWGNWCLVHFKRRAKIIEVTDADWKHISSMNYYRIDVELDFI